MKCVLMLQSAVFKELDDVCTFFAYFQFIFIIFLNSLIYLAFLQLIYESF